MNIDKMPAGRELDDVVFENVFGLRRHGKKLVLGDGEYAIGEHTSKRARIVERRGHMVQLLPSWVCPCGACYEKVSYRPISELRKEFCWDQGHNEHKSYSTNIAAAWEVVEKMRNVVDDLRNGGWQFDIYDSLPTQWRVQFTKPGKGICAYADTAPLAICLAALKALAS